MWTQERIPAPLTVDLYASAPLWNIKLLHLTKPDVSEGSQRELKMVRKISCCLLQLPGTKGISCFCIFVVGENMHDYICHNLGTGSKGGLLATDLVSNGMVSIAWWTNPLATGLSVERRQDKEKQSQVCESVEEQTQDRSPADKKRHCPGPLLALWPCLTVRGLLRVSTRTFNVCVCVCVRTCVHFLKGRIHALALLSEAYLWVLCFGGCFFLRAPPRQLIQQAFKRRNWFSLHPYMESPPQDSSEIMRNDTPDVLIRDMWRVWEVLQREKMWMDVTWLQQHVGCKLNKDVRSVRPSLRACVWERSWKPTSLLHAGIYILSAPDTSAP